MIVNAPQPSAQNSAQHSALLRRLLAVLTVGLLALGALVATGSPASAATARTLSIAASPTGATVGTPVTISGTLTKSPKGSAVTVQRKDGATWVTAKSVKTSTAAGRFSARVVVPSKVGSYSYRAVAAAKGSLKAATSKVVKVSALTRVTATIKATPKPPATLNAGAKATVSGTVKPFATGTTVTIQRFSAAGKWASTGVTAKLTSKGTFSVPVVVKDGSVFRVSVPRAGSRGPAVSAPTAVIANPVISSTSLPTAYRGTPYSAQLTQVGSNPGKWSVTPALPGNMSLNPSTGRITGTSNVSSEGSFTFKFAQPGLKTASKVLKLTVTTPPPPAPPVIGTTSLAVGTVGVGYATTLTANGNPAGTWSTSTLPAGLTLAPATGVISGTPTTAGTTNVTINFTKTGGLSAAPKVLPLVVNPPPPPPAPVISTSALPNGKVGQSYSFTLAVTGNPPGKWTVTGLPGGFDYNETTGEIYTFFAPPLSASVSQVTINFTADGNPTPAAQKVLTLTIKQ